MTAAYLTTLNPEQRRAVEHGCAALDQVPPMYSALKHQGQRLYELARAGQEVEREARPVRILELRLTGFGEGYFELDIAHHPPRAHA